jgi:hypothetical protein
MDRNFLSGTLGDEVNAMLAGAAWNMKMRLRELRALILELLRAACCRFGARGLAFIFRKPDSTWSKAV